MRIWRNQGGDTLVEVILALVILTAVIVSALAISRLTRVGSSNSKLRAQTINLVQEQYEALKNYRDRVPWTTFIGTQSNCSLPTSNCTGISRMQFNNVSGSVDCDPNDPGTQYCFHMERYSAIDASGLYGEWVPCPGPWYPPVGDDSTTWHNNPFNYSTGQQESTDYYYTTYQTSFGCRGSFRTQGNASGAVGSQQTIKVAIYYQPVGGTLGSNVASSPICTGGTPPALVPQSFTFDIRGSWGTSFASIATATNFSTLIANITGLPVGC